MRKRGKDPAQSPPQNKNPSLSLTRRSFLKGASVGAAGLAAARLPLPRAEAEEKKLSAEVVGPDPVPLTFRINGQTYSARLEPRVTLADALRDLFALTGTKVICDRGACGGCTVLLDNKPVVSCMVLAITAQDQEIRTVEGLAKAEGGLDPLQEAFIAHDALQCGYCTPGMLMSCRALLDRIAKPSPEEIKAAVSGNVCRCGTYPHVFAAVLAVSGQSPDLMGG